MCKISSLQEMLAKVEAEVGRLTQMQREEVRKSKKLKRDLNFISQLQGTPSK